MGTLLEEYAREQYITAVVASIANIVALIAGAVLISMAYQSWEVGVGAALLVFYHKS